jgi:hypothetical protein
MQTHYHDIYRSFWTRDLWESHILIVAKSRFSQEHFDDKVPTHHLVCSVVQTKSARERALETTRWLLNRRSWMELPLWLYRASWWNIPVSQHDATDE